MKDFRKFADNFAYAAGMIRKVSPGYFAGRIALLVAGLLLDYGLLFLWKDILNYLTGIYSFTSDIETVFSKSLCWWVCMQS